MISEALVTRLEGFAGPWIGDWHSTERYFLAIAGNEVSASVLTVRDKLFLELGG